METALRIQEEYNGDALIFFGFEKEDRLLPGLQAWLAGEGGWLAGNSAVTKFSGSAKSVRYFYPPAGVSGPVLILAGLGRRACFGVRELRQAVASAVGCAMDLEMVELGLNTATLQDTGLDITVAAEESVSAAMTAVYRFDRLKTEQEERKKTPTRLSLLQDKKPVDTALGSRLDEAVAVGQGLHLARDLVNMPANLATPEYLAETAREMATRHGFRADILAAEQIRELGMGAYAAVFQSNPEQARLIVLDTHPDRALDQTVEGSHAPLVLIGKGISFDTGGISLKPSQGMEEMKGDMGGAAAVLGFFEAYGRLGGGRQGQRRVVGIIPCTENTPGSLAIKPGDVVTSFSGKTVEIINTDAEGRLLLCDALAYSKQYTPMGIIDVATLTGAMVVSLGPRIAGVFAEPAALADLVRRVGERVGEPAWPMPLWADYKDELKSEVADLKNVGAREGGAIHAALFLQRFVPEKTPWVHLDIAGPAFAKKKGDHGISGGTGFGVRTLVELVKEWPEKD
ncbi:leucyl aminopeptidase [Desulfonatronum thioautotrophicum]|uniref:leucyl aminopeptidase n=1 Tax=Desulfonatronum thioautotrophicum TaxID=617001 RepID=UPI0005EB900A|nr:leucyl aminopeptidase [Desulfonatronum thioautotrophicum]